MLENSLKGLELESDIFLFLAAVLIAPMVLYRVVQVMAEGMVQPVVIKKECH